MFLTGKESVCSIRNGTDLSTRWRMTQKRKENLCKFLKLKAIGAVESSLSSTKGCCVYFYRFGMLFSLKDLTSKLSPDGQGLDHLHTVKTDAFTLHHYQSPSGLMFVLNTHPDLPGKLRIFAERVLLLQCQSTSYRYCKPLSCFCSSEQTFTHICNTSTPTSTLSALPGTLCTDTSPMSPSSVHCSSRAWRNTSFG